MNPCECSGAGYCTRHKLQKSHHWWTLCKTREDYRKIWDEGNGPGQPKSPESAERNRRVLDAAARTHRLIAWLSFFRTEGEKGIGDTVARLLPQADGKDVCHMLIQLQKSCSCKQREASMWLNKQWPY